MASSTASAACTTMKLVALCSRATLAYPLLQPRRPVAPAPWRRDNRRPADRADRWATPTARASRPAWSSQYASCVPMGLSPSCEITELCTLPQRVIGVLHRQLSANPGLVSRTPGGICHAQIADQRRHRPAVGGDMVQRRPPTRIPHRRSGKVRHAGGSRCARSKSRRATSVTALSSRSADQVFGVDDPPAEICLLGWDDQLVGNTVGCGEQGAQAFVACHHVEQGSAEGVDIKPSRQPQRHRHVVGRRRSLELVEEPQPTLGERQWHQRRSVSGDQRLAPPPPTVDTGGQPGDRRSVEQGTHREVRPQGFVDGRDHPHRRQRIPAQIEKRVVDPDSLECQNVGIDAGQDLLDRGGRSAGPLAGFERRHGQRAKVEFAVDGQRQSTR